MFIRFVTTGGTIDKIYFDDLSQYEVGESQIQHILHEGLVAFDYEVVPLLHKDSLEMTDEDRATLRDFIAGDDAERYVVTHGTDTMPETAEMLAELEGKTIVLTGAMIALARIGGQENEDGRLRIRDAFRRFLDAPSQEVRETAVLAHGILGDEASVDLLLDLFADRPAGRKAVGSTSVDTRRLSELLKPRVLKLKS